MSKKIKVTREKKSRYPLYRHRSDQGTGEIRIFLVDFARRRYKLVGLTQIE